MPRWRRDQEILGYRPRKLLNKTKKYNSQDSHVVTHHTPNWPACGLRVVDSRVDAARMSSG
jgi:hypothetical protein